MKTYKLNINVRYKFFLNIEYFQFVMFFDEAHLLFDRAPRALVDKIEHELDKGVDLLGFVSPSHFIPQTKADYMKEVLLK